MWKFLILFALLFMTESGLGLSLDPGKYRKVTRECAFNGNLLSARIQKRLLTWKNLFKMISQFLFDTSGDFHFFYIIMLIMLKNFINFF